MPIIEIDNALLLPLCNLVFLRQVVSIAHNTKGQNARLQKKRGWKRRKYREKRQKGIRDIFEQFA